ncbi:MAG: glycosyltransferase family 9 protein [bacterium]
MEKKKRILILALSGIGDALMFTPSLKVLREEYPNAQIDVLVMFNGVKEIFDRIGLADNIIFFEFLKQGGFKSLMFIFSLRRKYDISVNVYPSNRKEYNIIALLIGSKVRGAVKYLRKNFVELGYLNNTTFAENDNLHNVEENIKICELIIGKQIAEIPPLQLVLNDNDKKFAEEYIKKNELDNKFIVGVHAGCSLLKNHINRRWEPEKFVELCKKIIDKNKFTVLLFGGPDEEELNKQIIKEVNSSGMILVKTKSLIETISVMSYCSLFISNDSGLMHIAAALQIKLLPIIGPTSLNYIKPWQCEYKAATLNLECAPCFRYSPTPLLCSRTDKQFKCIKDLSVQKVYSVFEELIN